MLMRTYCIILISAGFSMSGVDNKQPADKEWWKTTLVYQIWPRGFQDSDDDGEGDLKGIISRLDYIKSLGIETIWINPIYSSPFIDSGYDVDNYTDINFIFGNFDDFDNLVKEAHNKELKIILDIIPNHSSDRHEWFQLSIRNIEPYIDYYIWANGSIDSDNEKIPPNNWMSTYIDVPGSAWTWHAGKEQWYYHKFHSSQPDLNLRNEKVIKELMNIFHFWLDKNVDGFQINAVPYFFEDEALRNELEKGTYTSGLPESTALLYTFRQYVDDWVSTRNNTTSKLLIAESYDSDANLMAYYGNSTHKGIPPFNFKFITQIHNNSNASYIKQILEEWIERLPENTSTNWVLSNHDNSRAASRIGLNRVDGLHMLSLLLPGQAYTYYGDEIAMLDAKILWNKTIDPIGCARGIEEYEFFSRDPARTPMQWNSQTSAGFSTNNITYLPVHPAYVHRNVEVQENNEKSNLKTYRKLASLRKNPIFTDGDYKFASLNNDRVLVLKRFLENNPVYIILVNLGLQQEIVNLTSLYPNLEDILKIYAASSNAIDIMDTVPRDNIILSLNAAVVVTATEENKSTDDPTANTTTSSTENTSTENTSTDKEELEPTKEPNAASSFTSIFLLVTSAIITVIVSYKFQK
ncbi:probable maltase [Linepithema humile]|uniref:probable maltase n=1 Tax=Linepithema humile TaxID=83485 RepID=UPI0006238BC0|nr:PREDICTED: probable maltase [Linepithema humile]